MSVNYIDTLVSFDLSHNRLGDGFNLEPLSHLTYLNLSGNSFSGNFESIGLRCGSINVLDLSFNKFTSLLGIEGFPRIKTFNISHNNLSGDITALSKLQDIKYLDLSYNNIRDNIPNIPSSNLQYLNLSHNKLPNSTSIFEGIPKIIKELYVNYLTLFNVVNEYFRQIQPAVIVVKFNISLAHV
ncbi:uncharacterized protein LOC126326597 [Schistocerca gregaria]|uniref:uncharacterized protein LOC126326597 n=1 Tax=Schistocerca gregaria TaxID=7010 RepID=UPI00211DEC6B|nr:uncharacterized protein LOC126326597 [Schistocerca gregaria]